jgi:hypothetical protein
MWDGEPIKDLLLLLGSDSLVFEKKVKKGGLKKIGCRKWDCVGNEWISEDLDQESRNTFTFGSSREASMPGLRFLKSLKIPSSNFFMFRTGRPKAY